MAVTSKYITISHQFAGIHCWAGCNIPEVMFLSFPHRHMFFVELVLPVNHDDRDLEFFMVKSDLQRVIIGLAGETYDNIEVLDLGSQSCEMIAEKIINGLIQIYPDLPWIRCSVKEDNENGGGVMWEAE